MEQPANVHPLTTELLRRLDTSQAAFSDTLALLQAATRPGSSTARDTMRLARDHHRAELDLEYAAAVFHFRLRRTDARPLARVAFEKALDAAIDRARDDHDGDFGSYSITADPVTGELGARGYDSEHNPPAYDHIGALYAAYNFTPEPEWRSWVWAEYLRFLAEHCTGTPVVLRRSRRCFSCGADTYARSTERRRSYCGRCGKQQNIPLV